eukprot:Selendium_serpulae@DN4628_c0_g1_i2.p1
MKSDEAIHHADGSPSAASSMFPPAKKRGRPFKVVPQEPSTPQPTPEKKIKPEANNDSAPMKFNTPTPNAHLSDTDSDSESEDVSSQAKANLTGGDADSDGSETEGSSQQKSQSSISVKKERLLLKRVRKKSS